MHRHAQVGRVLTSNLHLVCRNGSCLLVNLRKLLSFRSPSRSFGSIWPAVSTDGDESLTGIVRPQNYLIDSYLLHAASVLAANSVLRSLFGVAFPLFVSNMYANLGEWNLRFDLARVVSLITILP
jgi:hypothetical protein